MPQASDEQHALMQKWFGKDAIHGSDYAPMQFLYARGWTEDRGMWSKPTSAHNPSIYEIECLLFLRYEWDYDWHSPLFQDEMRSEELK